MTLATSLFLMVKRLHVELTNFTIKTDRFNSQLQALVLDKPQRLVVFHIPTDLL
tara:strand:- start:6352 stop:6513 length:162 start_codon:yes stop_codon:yes gene_type:complete